MTTEVPGGPTPFTVAAIATRTADLSGTTLIGVFGTDAAPGALVRLKSGDIVRVQLGDNIEGDPVIAIGEDSIALNHRGQSKILKLPASDPNPA